MNATGGPSDSPAEKNRKQFAFNVALGAVVGQVGCLTLIIILAALFGGLWLDNRLGTKPILTIIMMVGSVPVTLVLMFWVVKATTARILKNTTKNHSQRQEENRSGDEST